KKALARDVVAQFHGEEAADAAQHHFEQRFQARDAYEPEEVVLEAAGREGVPLFRVVADLGFARSNSEARRLTGAPAVRVDGEAAEDAMRPVQPGREHLIAV